jgi:methylmalonyl-CoA/ethylmalonyl-CoA epimerase
MIGEFINLGIAVEDIDEAAERYERAFGWTRDGEVRTEAGMGIRFVLLDAHGLKVELLSPLPGETTLRRFLDTRGEGLFRLAFAAGNFDGALAQLDASGVRYVDVSSASGRGAGNRIAFTHPKSAHGVMLELVEGHP